MPGDSIILPVSVAGSLEPTGADKLGLDIEGAKQLEDAGYVDRTATASARCPPTRWTGTAARFPLLRAVGRRTSVDAAPLRVRVAPGDRIKTEVTALNSAKLTDVINAASTSCSWGWYPDPDPSAQLALFTCDQRPLDGNTAGNNDAYYCNPEHELPATRISSARRTKTHAGRSCTRRRRSSTRTPPTR